LIHFRTFAIANSLEIANPIHHILEIMDALLDVFMCFT